MNWIFHIGIAQSFFSAFLLLTNKESNLPGRILGFWMIFIGLELLHMLFEINGSSWHIYTSNFGFYSLTFGPFMYLYVTKLTHENATFRRGDLLHFLPYVSLSLIHIFFFTNRPLLSGEIELDQGWFFLALARVITLFISLSAYSLLSFQIIRKHRRSLKDSYSFESSKITLNWIRLIIIIFISTYVILIINMLTGNLAVLLFDTSHLIPAIGLTFFCFCLSYYGFNQPVIFQSSNRKDGSEHSSVELTNSKRIEYLEKLTFFITKEKPYLNSELTISELAESAKIPRYYITEILKTELNKNFFTLIQDYRIKEVKNKLKDPSLKSESVLQIALESGFSSKSSFNALFKQYTGMTPSQFRSL